MARAVGRLSSLAVGRLKDPGLYPDGGGLYLQISRRGDLFVKRRELMDAWARHGGAGGRD